MSALTPQSDMPTPTTDKITQAAMETIYLCKFRVSMDGEWLCLRELDDISLTPDPEPTHEGTVRLSPGSPPGLVPALHGLGGGVSRTTCSCPARRAWTAVGRSESQICCFRWPSEFVTQPFKADS